MTEDLGFIYIRLAATKFFQMFLKEKYTYVCMYFKVWRFVSVVGFLDIKDATYKISIEDVFGFFENSLNIY